jgi:hypothetical protein
MWVASVFAGRQRAERGERRSPSRWRHDRSRGVARNQTRTGRGSALGLPCPESQIVTSGQIIGEPQIKTDDESAAKFLGGWLRGTSAPLHPCSGCSLQYCHPGGASFPPYCHAAAGEFRDCHQRAGVFPLVSALTPVMLMKQLKVRKGE